MLNPDQFKVGPGIPVPSVSEAAQKYAAQRGLRRDTDYSAVRANPEHAAKIAAMYEAAPDHHPSAVPAYEAMRRETNEQYEHMTRPVHKGGLGLSVEVSDKDPYVTAKGAPNSVAMMRDVHENRRIKVLSTKTTGPHPYFSDEDNDKFRAVHDVFGHAGTGRNFTADGEEAAWRSHASMYSPLARKAMTTETRGQNSVVNFGSRPGTFPKQKVALLPDEAQRIL